MWSFILKGQTTIRSNTNFREIFYTPTSSTKTTATNISKRERHWLISLKKKFRRAFSRMKSTAKRFISSEANFWIRRKS